jgi:hypothetical protein
VRIPTKNKEIYNIYFTNTQITFDKIPLMAGEDFPSSSGEKRKFTEGLREAEVNKAIDAVGKEIHTQIESPMNSNIHVAAFALAYENELNNPQQGNNTTENILRVGLTHRLNTNRNLTPASSIVGLLRASYYYQMEYEFPDLKKEYPFKLNKSPDDFEAKLYLAKKWQKIIKEVNSGDGISGIGGGDAVITDLAIRYVMTNKVERYKTMKFLFALLAEHLGHPPRILDIGCSRNHGLKALALNLPLGETDILRENYAPGRSPRTHAEVNRQKLNQRFNALQNQDIHLGESLGVDIWEYRDMGNQRWAKTCSLPPGERTKEEELKYNLLEGADLPNVAYRTIDLTTSDLEEEHYGQYDIVSFVTMLHLLPEKTRSMLLEKTKKYLNPDTGLQLIQDFAKKNPSKPSGIEFAESWTGEETMPYHAILIDPFDGFEGPREFIQWSGSRCPQGVVYESFSVI